MSSNPSPAKDPNAVLISLNRGQILGKFQRALIVDDQLPYAESVKENLSYIGFESTVTDSLEGAAHELHTRPYPVIICDNIFEGRPSLRGSEFIRDNQGLLGQGQVILMTGYPETRIVDVQVLKERGVKILKKGVGAIHELKEMCGAVAETRTAQYVDRLKGVCDELLDKVDDERELDEVSSDTHLIARTRSYLINYMKQIPNPNLPQFVIMGRTYSPNDLVGEIQQGSKVSQLLIDQILDDVLESPNK